MFKRANTVAKAHIIVQEHFDYKISGYRKRIFKKLAVECYAKGMNEFSIAFVFMLSQLNSLSDEHSNKKENWVDHMCGKMAGLIFDMEGFPEEIDPFDILAEQRMRFKVDVKAGNKTPKNKSNENRYNKKYLSKENKIKKETIEKNDKKTKKINFLGKTVNIEESIFEEAPLSELDIDWDFCQKKLNNLKGVGEKTAEKIIFKVRNGVPLTEREKKFWDLI